MTVGPALHTFMQFLIAFCSRLEAVVDVLSGVFVRLIVRDNAIVNVIEKLNLKTSEVIVSIAMLTTGSS